MSKLVGHIIGRRYRVDEFLGRGGMAEVYKVWDQQRATWLAMKVLHESLVEDRVFLRRFRREARNLAKLRHPNIVRFYEWGEEGEIVFILMEYISGVTLSKAIKRMGKPFSPGQALGIIQPICSALHYAHELGLAHCDIKPGNIMIEQTGRVVLTDFGIARVTEGAATATMVGAGTPAYMSPEQINGADPTPQTDIYAIGVVLFELLTSGERPFTGERATITGTIGEKIRWEKRKLSPPSPRKFNPEIPSSLETVVMRCMYKDRRKRYNSATMLMSELVRAAGDNIEVLPSSVFVDETTILEKPASTSKRKAFLVSGLVGTGFILVLILGVAGWNILNTSIRPEPQPVPVEVTRIVEVEKTVKVEIEVTSIQPTKKPTNPPPPTKKPQTNTPRPTARSSLSVNTVMEKGSRYIQVTGGPENYNKKFGPVADGELILGPNNIFCVYVDNLGNVYIVRFEGSSLYRHENIKQKLGALRNGATPRYDLRLNTDDNGTYTLHIYERDFADSYATKLPRSQTLE